MGRSTMSQVNDEDAGVLEEREELDDQAEFVDADGADDDAEIDSEGDEFGDDESLADDLGDYEEEFEAVDGELTQKEQNARSLAIRRAIEQRLERKRLDEDLDYLDFDFVE
jgi:hypothetical protein